MLLLLSVTACSKNDDATVKTKIKAPLRSYLIVARLDSKETNTASAATAILKGTYEEKTRVLSYSLTFEGLVPRTIKIKKGARGTIGVEVAELKRNIGPNYISPLKEERILTALQERDLVKGLWFLTIETENFSPEIRGQVTLKQK